ncbi:MAG: hypothetical protein HY664_05525 [Chloroflexi bacterium]|nr:hypothetical protein [Chloroflexota bacterium]
MRRIWLGLGILVVMIGLSWLAFGRNEGIEARTVKLSVVAQTLYGSGSGGVIKVKQDETITMYISVDESMEIFLHGYDVETRVQPGSPGTIRFTANIPGRHALMIHSLGSDGGSHEGERKAEILLGLVDVLPRK